MLVVRNLKVPLEYDFSDAKALFTKLTGVALTTGDEVKLFKKAVDARKKDNVFFSCSFTVKSENEKSLISRLKKYDVSDINIPEYRFKKAQSQRRPLVVGFGPCGMFAALYLAEAGLNPIVIERGDDADTRRRRTELFFGGGKLDPESNIQFGEGGAGTFSDGKLNTGIKDARIRAVLEIFAKYGAGEKILYDARPHIGTDVLINVVKNIRKRIESLGGKVLFRHKLVDFSVKNSEVCSAKVMSPDGETEFVFDDLILAIGHSARDTFSLLKEKGLTMEPKPFAIGVRIEHLAADIDRAQYGKFAGSPFLGAADYHLAAHIGDRGVFSFCMCPGGEVVNASSEPGGVVTNGMSNSERNGVNSNAGLLVGIGVDDFYKGDVLDGVEFQRVIERKAYTVGNGKPVCQTVGDFLSRRAAKDEYKGKVSPSVKTGVTFGDIRGVLPLFVTEPLALGITELDKKLHGFADKEALLTAPETRSSSPVRIVRNEELSSNIKGIYPGGEGAGYAGGITSAAVDGLKIAELITKKANK